MEFRAPLLDDYCKDVDDNNRNMFDEESSVPAVTSLTDSSSSSSSLPIFLDSLVPTNKHIQPAARNIRRILSITFFTFLSRSLWSQTLLSIYVILVWDHHPEYIGYVLATLGMVKTFSSASLRWFFNQARSSDNGSSTSSTSFPLFLVLICTSFIGLSAMGLFFYVIIINHGRSRIDLFLVGIGLWGMSFGMLESILPIVFAESASLIAAENTNNDHPSMERTYTRSSNLVRLGMIVGSLLTLVIFYWLGNEWSIQNCSTMILIGMGFNLPVVFLLCSLTAIPFDVDAEQDHDDASLLPSYDGIIDANFIHQGGLENNPLSSCPSDDEEIMDEDYNNNNDNNNMHQGSLLKDRFFFPEESDDENFHENDYYFLCGRDDEIVSSSDDIEGAQNNSDRRSILFSDSSYRVPILINIADVLSSIASGLSIFYYPVFLFQRLNLDPISIQFLYLLLPLGQWLSPVLAKALARGIGPCRACLSMQVTYVLSLLLMVSSYHRGYQTYVICSWFVVHGSLMNSTSSLSRSLISQFLSIEDVHNWGGVAENIQMLVWSCAGIIGGFVVGKWGILVVFLVTAALQCLATLPLGVLYCLLDPRSDHNDTIFEENASTSGNNADDHDGDKDRNNKCSLSFTNGFTAIRTGSALSPDTQATYLTNSSSVENIDLLFT